MIMSEAYTVTKKRTDYRTATGDRFLDYLLGVGEHSRGGFPAQDDWTPNANPGILARDFRQPHETARAGGCFVHVEGGKPAMKESVLDRLSGTPWQAVAIAVEVVRGYHPDAIDALEWMGKPAALRPSRYQWAQDHARSDSALSSLPRVAAREIHKCLPGARIRWWERAD